MKVTSVRPGAALLAGALILVFSSNSEAGWGHHRGGSSGGGSYGSSGASYGSSGALSYASSGGSSGYAAAYASSGGSSGYASHGSSGYASSGGSSGHVGLIARFKAHMEAKRARHAARRASHGSSGYASSGGSSGYSYASSGGSSGYSSYSSHGSSGYVPAVSYGSSGASVSYGSSGTVGSYHGASKASVGTAAGLVSDVRGDAVYLTVTVPSDAKIFVNDKPTTSTGKVRQFVSHGLEEGKSYKFVVRAELESAAGEVMVEEKELKVTAGIREDIRFAFDAYDAPVETALTLNVPEGAEVTLAGNSTKAQGESRVYRTSRLKPGQIWDDYEVEVRVGDQVKRRSVRLIGGDRLQLTFAFDDSDTDKLASR